MILSNIWALSDTHFFHKRIIELCNRPFSNVDEMNEIMISNWNKIVEPEDTVIFGGDFMFSKNDYGIFNRLKGHKILIVGNHDHSSTRGLCWDKIKDRMEIQVDGVDVIIDHYPLESWNKQFHGSVHLYGHVHNSQKMLDIPNRHCICVEFQNYSPKNIRDFLPERKD